MLRAPLVLCNPQLRLFVDDPVPIRLDVGGFGQAIFCGLNSFVRLFTGYFRW